MASRGRLRSQPGVAVKLRPKTQGRPCKISPAASRFLYSRPPLRDSTPVMRDSKSKAKPSEGTPEGPVDRGSAADYFGASPVASALNLPRERDSPKNRKQTTTHSSPARSKPDISTLQGIGHFYFALTTLTVCTTPAMAQSAASAISSDPQPDRLHTAKMTVLHIQSNGVWNNCVVYRPSSAGPTPCWAK